MTKYLLGDLKRNIGLRRHQPSSNSVNSLIPIKFSYCKGPTLNLSQYSMIYLNIMETVAVIYHNVIWCLTSNRKLFYTNFLFVEDKSIE